MDLCEAKKRRVEGLNRLEVKEKRSRLMKVIMNRAEVKRKTSKAAVGAWCRPDVRERIIKSRKISLDNVEVRLKKSESAKAAWKRLEVREKIIQAQRESNKKLEVRKRRIYVQNRLEVKQKKSDSQKKSWKNKSDREKQQWLSNILKSNDVKPNKAELFLDDQIQRCRPNEFEYVGCGQAWIGNKCPDWININGKRQVIELFGEYWHGESRNFKSKGEHELDYISYYKEYEFDCLIIWESELKNELLLLLFEKIKNF